MIVSKEMIGSLHPFKSAVVRSHVDDEVIVVSEDDLFDGGGEKSVGVLKVINAHCLEGRLQPRGAGQS